MLSILRSAKFVSLAVFLQAATVLLVAFGFLPQDALLGVVLLAALYMAFLPPLEALLFFILSIPWFVAVPLGEDPARLQSWRLLLSELVLIYVFWNFSTLLSSAKSGLRQLAVFLGFSWIDYTFFAYLLFNVLSLLGASFPLSGAKHIIWLFNIYLLFAVARLILRDSGQRDRLIKATAFSGLTIVAFGFVQLVMFMYLPQTFFWQFWANSLTYTLYGGELARAVVDYNSWFSYFPEAPPALRMFSLMPGSHYFSLVCILVLPFLLYAREVSAGLPSKRWWSSGIVLTLLGIVLSGVRGSWITFAGAALVVLFLFYRKTINRSLLKKAVAPLLVFVILFMASPLLQKGLAAISYSGGTGNLFFRAATSFNLAESSNAMRLAIWETSIETLKERPTLGMGTGNFLTVFGQPEEGQSFNDLASEDDPVIGIPKRYLSAHNIYLHVLVESGILGLLAFIAFIVSITGLIIARLRSSRNLKYFALFFGVAFAWVMTYSLFDVVLLYSDKSLMFFWLGLAVLSVSENK